MTDRVLITGAGGFIGSHLVERCVELGFKVKAFIKYNSRNFTGWLERSEFKKEIEFIFGDVRDLDSVSNALKNVDHVFHLAALIGIPYSYISPLAYVRTNVEGTYNILQAARSIEIENIIITSTSETYGSAQYVPIDEKHPLVGQSPYAASKIGADQLSLSYHKSFELPVKIVRPFNTYGPRQSARAFIPTVISQILNGKKKIRVGNLSPTRDLTYVEDTVEGFIKVFETNEIIGTVTNIGIGKEISMHELAMKIAGTIGTEIEFETELERVRPEESEVLRLLCDNKKIIRLTSWNPKCSLAAGLKKTYEWLLENQNYYQMNYYNV